jgi:hypothetical protein
VGRLPRGASRHSLTATPLSPVDKAVVAGVGALRRGLAAARRRPRWPRGHVRRRLRGVQGPALPRSRPRQEQRLPEGHTGGELTVDDLARAWEQAHAERPLRDRVRALRAVPLPDVAGLLSGRMDLAQHEAHGGHTIARHVSKGLDFLQARLRLEKLGKRPLRGSFWDEWRATAAVAECLHGRAVDVRHWASAAPPGTVLNLVGPCQMPRGRVPRGPRPARGDARPDGCASPCRPDCGDLARTGRRHRRGYRPRRR